MMRRAALLAVLTVASLGVARDAATAGDGDTSCGGNLIEYVPFNAGGQKIGQLQMYYNPGSKTFCAIMYHGGPSWGVRRDTGVAFVRARKRTDTFYTFGRLERDQFRYQAGPIRADGENWCVYASGLLNWNGKQQIKYTDIACR